jgi:HNH endonuclease/AP2 domain
MGYGRTVAPFTVEYLSSILCWDDERCEWRWNVDKGPSARKGDLAGGFHDGYLELKIDDKSYRSSNLVWYLNTGEWPLIGVDHKDQNSSNDRFANLRLATHSQNMANTTLKPGASGIRGVCQDRGRWYAQISGKWLGYFDTKEEAKAARHKAAIEKWGFDPDG